MTLNYVTLTLDLYDGQGNFPVSGQASFVPSAVLTDTGVEIISQQPVVAVFHAAAPPAVRLLATDSTGPLPSGWTWAVTFSGMTGAPAPFSFFLASANGATQLMSSLIPVGSGTAWQAYMPLPSGTPGAGQVPVATGSGMASAWGTVSGGGGGAVSSVFGRAGAVTATSGDYAVGQVTGAASTAYADSAVAAEAATARAAEALLAPLASPVLTGGPTAPTQAAGDTSTKLATDAFAAAAAAASAAYFLRIFAV